MADYQWTDDRVAATDQQLLGDRLDLRLVLEYESQDILLEPGLWQICAFDAEVYIAPLGKGKTIATNSDGYRVDCQKLVSGQRERFRVDKTSNFRVEVETGGSFCLRRLAP